MEYKVRVSVPIWYYVQYSLQNENILNISHSVAAVLVRMRL
jgi:hypothetical protein